MQYSIFRSHLGSDNHCFMKAYQWLVWNGLVGVSPILAFLPPSLLWLAEVVESEMVIEVVGLQTLHSFSQVSSHDVGIEAHWWPARDNLLLLCLFYTYVQVLFCAPFSSAVFPGKWRRHSSLEESQFWFLYRTFWTLEIPAIITVSLKNLVRKQWSLSSY